MKREVFDTALEEIWAVFGYAKKNDDMRDVWFERVKHIPDEAVKFITDKLCDLESLPRNLPRAWQNLWSDWKAANPKRIVPDADCPACGNYAVRWGWARTEAGKWMQFAIPCPSCQPVRHSGPTVDELERRDAVFMPPNYPGGPLAFDREKGFGVLWPLDTHSDAPRRTMHIGRLPDASAEQRTRNLTDAERDDYAAANW